VDDLAAQLGAQVAVLRILGRGGIGRGLHLRAQRAEQGLERVHRVGGSAGGDGGGCGDRDDRGGDLQIGMLDHDVPLDPSVCRWGGVPRFKNLPIFNPRAWLAARARPISLSYYSAFSLAACQPTTASATASVEAK